MIVACFLSFVRSVSFSYETRDFAFPRMAAVAASRRFGTFFLLVPFELARLSVTRGPEVLSLLFCCRVAVLPHAAAINGNHTLAVSEYLGVKPGIVASCHVGLVHFASTDSFIDIELSRINWPPINACPCLRQVSRRGLLHGFRQDLPAQFV
jgi:hypothetical protein